MSYTYNGYAYGITLGSGGPTTTSLSVNANDTILGAILLSGTGLPNLAVTDGGSNTYSYAPYPGVITSSLVPITFASAPTGTSATLSSTFSGTTGSYICIFSDGEVRYVGTVTNGSTTSLSWSGTSTLTGGALTGTPTTSANLYNSAGNVIIPIYAANCSSGSYTCTATISGGGAIQGSYFSNYTGVTGTLLGGSTGFYNGSATGNDKVQTGSISISQSAILWGLCENQNNPSGGTPLAGTITSFTARPSSSGIPWTSNNAGLAEDAPVSSSAAVTFGTAVGFDSYYAVALAFATGSTGGTAPFTPFNRTQFFVTDTIIQQ